MIILYYIHAGYDVHTYVFNTWMHDIVYDYVAGDSEAYAINDLYLGVLVLGLRDRP